MKLENNETLLAKTKQCPVLELPSIIAVLLMPLLMMLLANSKSGVVLGLLFLSFFLYWIVVIHNKLYKKTLFISDKKIIFEEKDWAKVSTSEIPCENIKDIKIKRKLINNLTDTGTLNISCTDNEYEIINIKTPEHIKSLIEQNCSKSF